MNELNVINTRIKNKNDTTLNWDSSSFIPMQGEIIIYNDTTPPKIKIGDDLTPVPLLPFIDANALSKTEQTLTTEEIQQVHTNLHTDEYVENLYKRLNSNTVLGFYCIEDVTINVNGISTVYPANSNVEIKLLETDVFEVIPTSDKSILQLNAFPGALRTFYPWLEGVRQFSNILFDMNDVDFYSKWSQGNQGSYQVQYAQYLNCVFWSDNPYVSDVSKRTNYTLYNTSQLPLCYSSIPDNTFKSFYLAFNVNSDPNWGNQAYRDSFAKATWATQVFSYYGARTIGIFGHDDPGFNIVLPKDCRGLMYQSTAIENAGTFDAINTTNFGAKSGSWRDAFGQCSSLRNLFIKNLTVNLNVSWSPLNYESIYFIISKAANTKQITISVSPHTYNLLGPSDFELAASKNIVIELITTNYHEDRRLGEIANKANQSDVLIKAEQTLTEEELTQVRKNLKFIGKDVEGQTFTIDGTEVPASANAEIFGDYVNNIAVGQWSIAEGSQTIAKGRASHAEGALTQALADGTHTEGYQTKATGFWSHAEGEMTLVSSYASHAEGSYCTLPDGTKRYGTASGYASHVEGGGSYATASCSHAEGLATTASGAQSHAEGRYTIAKGGAQHVEGIANIEDTEEKYIHIAGNGSFGAPSNAYTLDWDGNGWFSKDVYVGSTSGTNKDEGSKKLATENFVTESLSTKVNIEEPRMSGALGLNHTGELGWAAVSLGFANTASGMYSFAEGMGTKATGDAAHAEGTGNTASGSAAHAEGYGTEATETGAHAEGAYTKATGFGSHAEGSYTIASGEGQHAEGKYNLEDSTAIHVVGNGTAEASRSNAHTLGLNGEAWFSGDVYVGSTSGTHKDEGSKKLATENYVSEAIDAISLSGTLQFGGVVEELPATSEVGTVVLFGTKEYVYNTDNTWRELGDEGSHALKTVTITAGSGLTGGGTLETNRTIGHSNVITAGTAQGSNVTLAAGGKIRIPTITYDSNGHITKAGITEATLPNSAMYDIANNEIYTTYLKKYEAGKRVISADSLTPIRFQSKNSHGALIEFANEDGTSQGYLGVYDDKPSYYKGNTAYTLLHEGNYKNIVEVDVSKLTQDEEVTLILDCND